MVMKKASSLLIFLSITALSFTQESIDGGFPFQTENFKSYHVYIPSDYNEATPHQMMVAFHPFNTNRWDGESWRDTLITFAETNSLILLSPDGGADGKVDDPIDTSFTSLLIDSMSIWFNIDETERYAMGFSWGGRTTYTYGLNNASKFKGFMPIGAAASVDMIQGISQNAENKPFFLVHGSQDSPNVRYTPFLNELDDNNACVESVLMNGVGHTIDFPDRNMILSNAFAFLKNEPCPLINANTEASKQSLQIIPNPNAGLFSVKGLEFLDADAISIYTINGERMDFQIEGDQISILNERQGFFILHYVQNNTKYISKIYIQ